MAASISPLPEDINPAARDAQTVATVRAGDTLAYRELVERYQKQVYGVAWSRLGDAALAEDAAQEAFVLAYQALPLLNNGAKFSAWITTITRNAAIRLGVRQRRELEKRRRWALEQPLSEPSAVTTTEDICSPELLRQSLAELPDDYRECLVLFYLEGKRGVEAAAALGISEPALRMRLMRARSALREKLETRLGESLEQLQPSHALVPSVMGAVTSTSMVKSTGLGTAVLAALSKLLPFKFAAFCAVPIIAFAPGLVWWGEKLESADYAASDEYRRRLYKADPPKAKVAKETGPIGKIFGAFWKILGMAVPLALMVVMGQLALHWFSADSSGGKTSDIVKVHDISFSIFIIWFPLLFFIQRRLAIQQGLSGCLHSLVPLILIIYFINQAGPTIGIFHLQPLRPVYANLVSLCAGLVCATQLLTTPILRGGESGQNLNLFLLAARGMLKIPAENQPVAVTKLDRAALRAFAKFLESHALVMKSQWNEQGLQLWLPPITQEYYFHHRDSYSWIQLERDGAVLAHGSSRIMRFLQLVCQKEILPLAELEAQVSATVAQAWSAFRAGDLATAKSILGDIPSPPQKFLTSARVMGVGILAFLLAVFALDRKDFLTFTTPPPSAQTSPSSFSQTH